MTWYRQINPLQEPFDLGLDEQGRQVIGFNVAVVKAASSTFRQEITKRLEDEGVATFGTNMFRGALAKIPDADAGNPDPILHLRETGGTTPERTQNEINPPAYQRPSMQITARSTSYTAADTMARAAYAALNGVRNIDLAPA